MIKKIEPIVNKNIDVIAAEEAFQHFAPHLLDEIKGLGNCMFFQVQQSQRKGSQLEGAGLIVPKQHRETVFDMTHEEWGATYTLLQEVKKWCYVNKIDT